MYNQIDANKRRTTWLFLIFFIVMIAIGWVFSYIYNSYAILVIVMVIALVQAWVSYYYSDQVALATSRAVEAPQSEFAELHRVVENLAISAGLPKPKIYVINDPAPNAFATGRDPQHASIAVTTGLLEMMNKTELQGVIAHELSHVGNRDILVSTVVVVLVGVLVLLSDMFLRSMFWGGLGGGRRGNNDNDSAGIVLIVGIVLAILAPLIGQLMQLAISRKREYLADASGALLTRYPDGLASALQKLENYERPMQSVNRATSHLFITDPFGDPDQHKTFWFTALFSTHPPIEDRIKRLKEMDKS